MSDKPLKLHIGCGRKKIHGFTNIDILPDVDPDLVEDIFLLPSYQPESVDLIYACHCLEHSDRNGYARILQRWHEVLKVGGVLRLAVPDIGAAFKWYGMTKDLRVLRGFFWGGQKNDYDHHGIGWDASTLIEDLSDAGFQTIHPWDWRKTEHSYVDDYSQSYLPHMAKESGVLMSLNLEAVK